MKILHLFKSRRFYFAIALLTFFLISCQKETEFVDQSATDSFVINVVGVEEPVDVINKVASTAVRDNFTLTSEVIDQGGGFYTETMPLELSKMESILDKSAVGSQKLAAAKPMTSNKTFAIIIYNLSNNQVVAKQIAKVGTPTVIAVNKNVEYGYVAFSYNNSETTLLDGLTGNNLSAMEITSPRDKDFLYVKGKATAPGLNTPINLTFQHKVSQVDFRINTSAMSGFQLDPTAAGNLEATFNANNTPLSEGNFSLLNGSYVVGSISTYSPVSMNFSAIAGDTLYSSTFYTASPTAEFTVDLTKMEVSLWGLYGGTVIAPVQAKVSWIPVGTSKAVNFKYGSDINGALGKKIIATMYPFSVLPEQRILHASSDNVYGYAASPTAMTTTSAHNFDANAGASYNMLKAEVNFGAKRSSKFKIKGFSHIRATSSGGIANVLRSGSLPDIIIIGSGYTMNSDDRVELLKYTSTTGNGVNNNALGGIPVLWLVSASNYGDSNHQSFYNTIFSPAIGQTGLRTSSIARAGTVYNPGYGENRITTGVFQSYPGNWGLGEHCVRTSGNWQTEAYNSTDRYAVYQYYAQNIPLNQSINDHGLGDDGFQMMDARYYAVTYVGDGKFLSNDLAYGARTDDSAHPFATNFLYQPVPRKFGYDYRNYGANFHQVHNSLMFGNFMAYAALRARFFGVNKLAHDAAASQP